MDLMCGVFWGGTGDVVSPLSPPLDPITPSFPPNRLNTQNKTHPKQHQEKVVLLSLMNLAFATPAHERTLPFAAIAERGRIGVEQVCGVDDGST